MKRCQEQLNIYTLLMVYISYKLDFFLTMDLKETDKISNCISFTVYYSPRNVLKELI
jgi:hypothetical protein